MVRNPFVATFALGLFLVAGTAVAAPMTWIDTVDVDVSLSQGQSVTYTHNITDETTGFILGEHKVKEASLSIELRDDGDDPDSWCKIHTWEVALITSEDGAFFKVTGVDYDDIGIKLGAVATLNESGLLDITVRSLLGDFDVRISTLYMQGDDGADGQTSAIPEPSAAMLFGLGALVVGSGGRRKHG